MQQFLFAAGDTSQTIDVFLPDSSSATGGGLTGLVYNSAGLTCYYRKGATGTATAVTLATQTVGGAYSSGGFVQIDSTNQPGMYRFDIPDTVLAVAGKATLYFRGATNLAPTPVQIQIGAPVSVAAWLGTVPNALVSGRVDASVGAYQTGLTPLQPTVAGRTLDVSAGGEAGVDWANIGAPTTVVNLSGTTVATVTNRVTANTDQLAGQTVTAAAGVTFPSSVGTSTLTQTQVTGGAYALNSASFAFNAALDFTTAQKAATLARVTLVDTLTTYTGNTPQTGDSFARIGATGSGLTSLAPSATALSTAVWTNTLATNLGTTNTTVAGNLDATVSSRASTTVAPSWYTAPGTVPTAAEVATAVWQDATAGDFTAAGSIGKSLYTAGNAPGAASGLSLVGSAMTLTSAYDPAKTAAQAATALSTAQWTNALATNLGTLAGHDPGSTLASAANVAAVPAATATAVLAAGDVDGYTLEQTLKLCLASLAGKVSGGGTTTITIRAADDSANRITATVDSNGNRTAVTLNAAG